MRRLSQSFLLHLILGLSFILSMSATSASAATNCRQVARDIQSSAAEAMAKSPTAGSSKFIELFSAASVEYPECRTVLEELWNWNLRTDPNEVFPFAKSGDPRSSTLGPIGWWWDTIYNDLLDGNTFFMLLIGWEMFLVPILMLLWLAILILSAPFTLVSEWRQRRRQ
jgi:hypothetical protein